MLLEKILSLSHFNQNKFFTKYFQLHKSQTDPWLGRYLVIMEQELPTLLLCTLVSNRMNVSELGHNVVTF